MAMVAYRNVTIVVLVCVCSAAYGQQNADYGGLQFFPRAIPADAAAELTLARSGPADDRPEQTTASHAAAVAGNPTSAPAIPDHVAEAVGRRLDAIDEEIAANGPRSPALAGALVELAALYQEAEAHLLAIDMLERALAVIRINEGLYSLEQVDVLDQTIVSRVALGQYAETARLDRNVLELVLRNHEDPRVPAILRTLAERQLAAFRRLLEEPLAPQLTVTVTTAPDFAVRGPPQDPALAALRSARRHYSQALDIAARRGEQPVAELFELEERIIETLYLEIENPKLHGSRYRRQMPPFIYGLGEVLFEAHVRNVAQFSTPEAVAAALMRLGDWRLLFSNNGRALQTYRRAHELLVQQSVSEQAMEEILAPDVPRALPVSERSVAAEVDPPPHRGYIDVTFLIGRYGTSRRVEILDASPGTPRAVERRLKQQIYHTRFRPRFVEGELARADEAVLRYYYDY